MLAVVTDPALGGPPPLSEWVVLSGFMGAGKSTVGRILAARMGGRFVDLDGEIERSTGSTVAELFATFGETGFRDIEERVLTETLRGAPGVLALGGGTVLRQGNRARLRCSGVLVTLEVSPEVARARLAGQAALRPNLDADAEAFRRRAESRAAAYAEADLTLSTDASSPERVAEDVLAALAARGAL